MKVLILGFDALEYDLVKQWKLRQLMQVRYGVYEAAISPKYKKPHTPSAWTTIITGKYPEEHGIDDWWTYGKILDWLRTKPPLVWIKNKRKILWKLGIRPKLHSRNEIKVKTIFDLTSRSIALFIPGYNEPVEPHMKLNEAIKKGIKEYIKTIWEVHRWRVKTFLEELNNDWDLFMVWFDIADLLGHVCMVKCRKELWKAYLDLARLVGIVKKEVPEDTLILILSDHGMKPMPDGTGDHSEYGFWSINMDLEWFNPKKAVDFYPLIEKALKM